MVVVGEVPPLDRSAARTVAALWDAARAAEGAHLFDGEIYVLGSARPDRIEVLRSGFRRHLGLLADPSLAPGEPEYPVGVNGLTTRGDAILLGRRSRRVTQYPGMFELAPSGTLAGTPGPGGVLDARGCLLAELEEETGLPRELVRDAGARELGFDAGASTWEIVYALELDPGAPDPATSAEYDEVRFVPRAGLAGFLRDRGEDCAPFSRAQLGLQLP